MTPLPVPRDPAGPPLEARLAELEALIVTDAPRASGRAAEAVRLARAGGDGRGEGQALCLLGAALFFQANYGAADERFREALALGRNLGDLALQARALNGLGNVANLLGDYAGALEAFGESARLSREGGDAPGEARVLNNVGLIYAELGDYPEALRTHLGVLETARQLGDPLLASSARVNALVDHHALEDHDRALALADECLRDIGTSGLRQHEVIVRAFRARSLLELGQVEAARAACLEALPLAREIGEDQHALHLLDTLAHVALAQGDRAGAVALLTQALTLAGERGLRPQERDLHALLADVSEAQEDYRAAVRHLRAYHALERALHAEEVDRKARVLTAQFQAEALKREAETQRRRSEALAEANTALREDHDRLAHRAAHDPLTGLANRAHFQAAVARALRERGDTRVAVLFLDLDRFKLVNDTHGHEAGDELLRQVAGRLRAAVRRGDLAARVGGDEFTVLLTDLRGPRDAERVGQKVLEALAPPFRLGTREVRVTASVGVAVAPDDGEDVDTLHRRADEAMYRVKHGGRNGVQAQSSGPG